MGKTELVAMQVGVAKVDLPMYVSLLNSEY